MFLITPPAFAQTQDVEGANTTSFGIANYVPIVDTNVDDGDIVSFAPTGYHLSNNPYDNLIVGVVNNNPAISVEINSSAKSYPVVSTGDAFVNVTTQNGDIKKGDAITTSATPGVGMKATQTGYVIGAALADYASNDKHAVKKIPLTLNAHYYIAKSTLKNGFLAVLDLSSLATYEEPIQAFKYFVAAATLVLSFVFGFFSFARTANKGLEALGRNPLASRMIQTGILLNTIVSIIIVLSGLVVAFFVIRL